MKVWPEREESPWYNLHLPDDTYDVAYGERWGYTVIDVPDGTVARWQQALAEAQSAITEIAAAMDTASPEKRP